MRFLADVNIPQSAISALTKLGYDVFDLKRENLEAKDTEIIERAHTEGRIILTRDKDFLALTQFPKYQVPTIVLRLKNQNSGAVSRHLSELVQNQKKDILASSLTIVTEESADSYPYD